MNYIDIFGELRSREIGGFVTDKSQVKGLSDISLPVRAAYDKSDVTIKFYDSNNEVIQALTVNATDFIKYGLLDDVRIENDCLVMDFNTDSGKTDISIPLIDIFNPNNYYLKEEVDKKTSTTSDIPVVSGPLVDAIDAENWPTEWYNENGIRIIPGDKPLNEVLSQLFFKLIIGTVNWRAALWNPTLAEPKVSLSLDAETLEVGTTMVVTATANDTVENNVRKAICQTNGFGYFDSVDGEWQQGDKEVSVDGTVGGSSVLSATWNQKEANLNDVNCSVVIAEGVNTLLVSASGLIASVEALPETTVYASTNMKQASPRTSATLTDEKPSDVSLAKSKKLTKIGSYYYFIGQVPGTGLDITGDMVKAHVRDKMDFVSNLADEGTEVMSALSVDPNGNTYIIAVPEGYTVKQILTLGNNALAAWTEISVDVTLLDGTTKPYTVFYIENKGSEKIDFTNLKLGK